MSPADTAGNLIHDRGRGPELVGSRITVYNLLPHFLDPTATEAYVCQLYDLTPKQVAAARAYILNHPETVLTEHLKIEQRLATGNPPEVAEQARQTQAKFLRFKDWLASRERGDATDQTTNAVPIRSKSFPTFREWLTQQETRPVQGP